jgi:hypothetical protein
VIWKKMLFETQVKIDFIGNIALNAVLCHTKSLPGYYNSYDMQVWDGHWHTDDEHEMAPGLQMNVTYS